MFDNISKVSIKVTGKCCLCCEYCHQLFKDKYQSSQRFEDYHNLKNFLLSLPFTDVVDVTITGGEITMVENDFLKTVQTLKSVERMKDVTFDICIITNGTNMDLIYDWCNKKIIKPNKTSISWDGIYSASKSRKTSGKYDDEYFCNVIKGLGKSEYNHDISIVTAVTPNTIDNLYDSYDFCINNGVYNWGYYFIHEGNYDNEEFEKKFRDEITKIAKRYIEIANSGEEVCYYNWQLIHTRRKFPTNFHVCSKLGNNYHIDMNGDIYPCIYFGDHRAYKLGNISEGIDENTKSKFIEEYTREPLCEFKCCGNVQCSECPASNFVHNKSLNARFKNTCKLLTIENEIYDEYSPLLESFWNQRTMFIPKDEYYKYVDTMKSSLEQFECTDCSLNDSVIISPNYQGVRQWF